MKQSYETQAILNDARIGVNKIYISKEVREENCEEIYSLIVNDECIIPKEYWLTVVSNSGEETTKKGTGDIWSNCIPLSGGGGVLSVTGSLVSGTPENPIIGDYNNVVVQTGDIVEMNPYSGTLRLYANGTVDFFNIDWNELLVDTKTVTIQFGFDCDDIINTTSTGSGLQRLPSKCKDLDVWQVMYTHATDTWDLVSVNSIGTDRQVEGYSDGAKYPVTLGWRHFSDLPNPPTFNTGVLSGTMFNPDGTAMFYFHELNNAVGASAKALTIPVYTTSGRLKVGNAVNADEAMSLGQLNTMVSTTVSGSTIAKREQDGTIAVAYAGEEYSAVPLRQMLEFAGTTVVRPAVGSTTVIPIGAKGKYIIVYSGTGGDINIDLGIADLLNNQGLEIVVINKSADGNVVLRSFSGQTQILPDAGGALTASTTIGVGYTQNFICDGIHVIGV